MTNTRIQLLIGAALGFAVAVPRAEAFDLRFHRQITDTVLVRMGLGPESIAIVIDGNLSVDAFDEFTMHEAHFDNEAFSKGSRRLREKRAFIMELIDEKDRENALYELGKALHAVQDFFAHSNFIENNAVDAPIDLFNLNDPPSDLKCDRNTFEGGLTSGYFPDDERPSELKCVHAELNKDSPSAGQRHQRAVEKAMMETRRFVADLFVSNEHFPALVKE